MGRSRSKGAARDQSICHWEEELQRIKSLIKHSAPYASESSTKETWQLERGLEPLACADDTTDELVSQALDLYKLHVKKLEREVKHLQKELQKKYRECQELEVELRGAEQQARAATDARVREREGGAQQLQRLHEVADSWRRQYEEVADRLKAQSVVQVELEQHNQLLESRVEEAAKKASFGGKGGTRAVSLYLSSSNLPYTCPSAC
jgi:hypothetical protein